MKEIPLTKGEVALVDDADYEELAKHKWCVRMSTSGCLVAIRNAKVTDDKNGPRQIQMHRWLMKAPRYTEVDHANGNTLDNRRGNLRLATRSQNLANRKVFHTNLSGYKGVSPRGAKFNARIEVTCDTAEEAARTYDRIARFIHGDFAKLNFPDAV